MADKTDKAAKTEKCDFTPREMEILAMAWTCMEEPPKVDYNKLAEAVGMANPRSASNAWAIIKKKILAKGGIAEKKVGEDDEDGDNGENGEGTPKAKAKATPKRKKAATATAGPDDDEGSPTKKAKATPKTPRGKGKKSKAKADSNEDAPPVKEEEPEEGEVQED